MTTPTVTLRYWAAARSAAGREQDQVAALTLADAIGEATRLHTDTRFSDVIAICSILHGEIPVGAADPAGVRLADGDVIEFLPPFAGG